jgi:ribosomal protein S18 acetylase RimI-like enzyme
MRSAETVRAEQGPRRSTFGVRVRARFAREELSPIDDPNVPVLTIGVERDDRGRGVGGLLMDALIEEARASDVPAISLTTGLFYEAAIHLYRRRGFAEVLRRGEGVQMRLDLG